MTVVTPRTLTRALREHLALWISDYLGVAETQDGLDAGTAARPAPAHGWRKGTEWPPTDTMLSTGPCIWIVDHGVAQNTRRPNVQAGEIRATRVLEIATVCHPDPDGGNDGRNLADLYGQALHQLLASNATFGDGDQRVVNVEGPYPQYVSSVDNVKLPAVVVMCEVDCAIGQTGLTWDADPAAPNDSPRDPETPVSALSITTTVEAQQ